MPATKQCDECARKYGCKKHFKGKWHLVCKYYRKIKPRKRAPFNSKKYPRNPRERGYMLLKRRFDGTIYALTDQSFAVDWQTHYGILWHDYINAEFYLHECRKWKDYDPADQIFIVRVGTKRCPIEVDFKREAPRTSKGNVYFKLRDNIDHYYKAITHMPV